MIDELRETMDRHATRVVPRPGPYPRLLRRRRQRRAVMAAATASVLLIAGPLMWLRFTAPPAYVHQPGKAPASLQPLLSSPTRGSLATDTQFINALLTMAAAGTGMSDARLPDTPERLKVLFAGDLGQRRVAVVAGLDALPLRVIYQGNAGDSPENLVITATGELLPVVDTDFASDSRNTDSTYLLLGPSGAAYEVAHTRYTSTSVVRTWTDTLPGTDYLGVANLTQRQRFRVVAAGTVLAETQAGPASTINVTVDPQPAGGRGTPAPDAANQIAGALARMTELGPADAAFRVLWSDEIDMPGTAHGRAYVVTVQAVVAGSDGGPYLTGAISVGEGFYRDHPSGYGIAGDVATSMIVMRLPAYTAGIARLQLIGPPAGVRAEVTWDGTPTTITLVNGVGNLSLPPNTHPVVRVFDSAGNVLATKQYTDVDNFACDRFDRTACSMASPSPAPTRTS